MAASKIERQKKIRKLVYENDRATVFELCEELEASEATIRRDLEELAAQGAVQRFRGGAMRPIPATPEPPIVQRTHEQADSKNQIAAAAAELVQDGETVFLGSGSTVLVVAEYLKKKRDLTVISNSLPVINLLADVPNITLVVLGGLLRKSERSMIGHLTEQAVSELRADKVIMGIRAIDLEQGLTNDYLPETKTDRAVVRLSSKVILVADHTKFGRVATAFVAPLSVVDTVVTDAGIDSGSLRALAAAGIEVLVAGNGDRPAAPA